MKKLITLFIMLLACTASAQDSVTMIPIGDATINDENIAEELAQLLETTCGYDNGSNYTFNRDCVDIKDVINALSGLIPEPSSGVTHADCSDCACIVSGSSDWYSCLAELSKIEEQRIRDLRKLLDDLQTKRCAE